MWCLPGAPSAEFVWAMEDVLDIYTRPYDPTRPTVCLDETSKQLVGEVRAPLPAIPGHAARYDHHYVRNGVATVFMMLEPLTGRCRVQVTQRRTKKDWAQVMKDLVDRCYPEADALTLVMDNLSSHQKAALYDVFAPEEAKRIADKIDIHFTPKRGSWLNMAEIGLKVLSRQCLDRRIGTIQQLSKEVHAWLSQREKSPTRVKWQFTTDDARIKLHRLYPALLHR
jgi:hypothetical protein